MRIGTKCVQSGYEPKGGEARVVPINMSTTFRHESTQDVGDLFDLKKLGFFYTRLSNPTTDAVEKKLNDLEGGVGAMLTSSGQSATYTAIATICKPGDHIVSSATIYGGTYNLLGVTLKRMGIDSTFVNPHDFEAVDKAIIKGKTKALFAETIANPQGTASDLERLSNIAHAKGIPLIVDNTFATPILCRPFEHGVDIVVHSTTKYLDGHAVAMGGVVIDSGNFDWVANGYTDFSEPDTSYHGLKYSEAFGKAAFIFKARVQLMRDLGMVISPMNSFLLNLGLETLHLRMPRHSDNGLAVAKYLSKHKAVGRVDYPLLESNPYYKTAKKYLPSGAAGVVALELGSHKACVDFTNKLKLTKIVVHVCDARSSVLHPASSTNRQMSPDELKAVGISDKLVRLSIGIEDIEDILEDIEQALR